MEIINVETTLTEAIKITDIGERMLFWHNFKEAFDKLTPEKQEIYRVNSKKSS